MERAGHPKRKKLGRGLRDRVCPDQSVLFSVKICPHCVQTTALFMSGTFYRHLGFLSVFEPNPNTFMNMTNINILFILSMELFKVLYDNR